MNHGPLLLCYYASMLYVMRLEGVWILIVNNDKSSKDIKLPAYRCSGCNTLAIDPGSMIVKDV